MTKISLLFLSDLHAFSPSAARKGEVPSFIEAGRLGKTDGDDAFEALKRLIREEEIAVDLVICGGDLGDKADEAGLEHAWRELQAIGGLTRASRILAVCGNHDLNSRHLETKTAEPDPKGALQDLTPPFPIGDESLCDRFWARNYAVIDDASVGFRTVLLNSSAFHGGKEGEIEHGRVATRTVNRLRKELSEGGPRDLNIFVCHHHPFPHSRLDGRPDYEALQNGQTLLELLDDPIFGPWILMHGHRHNARITYAPSSASVIPVIGAASFSARVSDADNQVHLVEVESVIRSNYALRGRIKSWTFSLGRGFIFNSKATNGLPGECGFGFRGNIQALARTVGDYIRNSGSAYVQWEEIKGCFEDVIYLEPKGFEHLINSLQSQGIRLSFDISGRPLEAIAQ